MSKKTIEIPIDVARAFAFADRNRGTPMANAIMEVLPPSRDDRLGLPWVAVKHEDEGVVYSDCGHYKVNALSSGTFVAWDKARLIAKAPEMAAMLERLLLKAELHVIDDHAIKRLLREAGWLGA